MGSPVVIVMGVSGSGKTTVGRELARRTAWPFLDADDLHSPESIERMATGTPLTDADRWPWLDRVADWIAARRAAGEPGIVACSALKRVYRDRLRRGDPDLRVAYLRVEIQEIFRRVARRTGHFFPPGLIQAQFADLEEPTPDEAPITVAMNEPPDVKAESILAELR